MNSKQYNQEYYLKNKKQIQEIRKIFYKNNKEKIKNKSKIFRLNNMTQIKEYLKINYKKRSKYQKEWREKNRLKVLIHYSNGELCCSCCGEKEYKFLSIDHINGGGAEHRRKIGRTSIVRWLIANNFPEGFQILCHNCNLAKGLYGKCPHLLDK